jgi:hypothetical protein
MRQCFILLLCFGEKTASDSDLNCLQGAELFIESNNGLSYSTKCPSFMEPDGALSCA